MTVETGHMGNNLLRHVALEAFAEQLHDDPVIVAAAPAQGNDLVLDLAIPEDGQHHRADGGLGFVDIVSRVKNTALQSRLVEHQARRGPVPACIV